MLVKRKLFEKSFRILAKLIRAEAVGSGNQSALARVQRGVRNTTVESSYQFCSHCLFSHAIKQGLRRISWS